jgi:hypothetical protein
MRKFWYTPDEIVDFFYEGKSLTKLVILRIERDWLNMIQDLARREAELSALQTPCVWKYDDYDCYYMTSCGEIFQFEDGTAEENNCHYCHNCGHPVKVVMPETNQDAEEESSAPDGAK